MGRYPTLDIGQRAPRSLVPLFGSRSRHVILEPTEVLVHHGAHLIVGRVSGPEVGRHSAFDGRHEGQRTDAQSRVPLAEQRLPCREIAEEPIKVGVQFVVLWDLPFRLFDLSDHIDDVAQHAVQRGQRVLGRGGVHRDDAPGNAPSVPLIAAPQRPDSPKRSGPSSESRGTRRPTTHHHSYRQGTVESAPDRGRRQEGVRRRRTGRAGIVTLVPVSANQRRVADLLVRCLENEGVRCVFGIPGEENIYFTDALSRSSIRYVLVRHEQAASFMAEIYGRLTGRAGVCSATLGPGAINLLLGTADANANSTPVVAFSAQVGLNRIYKESHQGVDLVSMFSPVTKWAELVLTPGAVPEMVRKAFKLAQTERPGAVYLGVPEDIEDAPAPAGLVPLRVNVPRPDEPSPSQIERAAAVLDGCHRPVVLAGHGAARSGAADALRRFSELLGLPVATTFHGKGVFPDDHPHSLGAVGFMSHDYVNFGFDEADVIVSVGYELQEFDPVRINPRGDKRILHLSRFPAEVDAHYDVEVGIQADIGRTLDALGAATNRRFEQGTSGARIRQLLVDELAAGATDDSFPLKPQRIVADTRATLARSDIVLADTGAVKMWMARLYPTYEPNTCLISNGLSTMAFALPGAIGARLAAPDRRALAAVGDGAFLMSSQEIETALRERVPLTVLIWQDDAYGLIRWKMDLQLGHNTAVGFSNPDFVRYAESFGAEGYQVRAAGDLLPALTEALSGDGVSVIACPVDYAENLRLTDALGALSGPF